MSVRKRTAWCFVPKCPTNSKKNTDCSFFRFPKESKRSKEWVRNSGRKDLLHKDVVYCYRNYKICSLHFEFKMFDSLLENKLKKNAVPTVFGRRSSPPPTIEDENKEPNAKCRTTINKPLLSPPSPQDPLQLPSDIEQKQETFSSDCLIYDEPSSPQDPLFLPDQSVKQELIESFSDDSMNESSSPSCPQDPLLLPEIVKQEMSCMFEKKTIGVLGKKVEKNYEL